MSCYIYKVAYLGAPRNHHAIFVETDADESGVIFHVTGDIQSGMKFETKGAKRPEDSSTFVDKTLLGWVTADNFQYIEGVCRGVPPPSKQFERAKRLYPKEPLRRCQEWTNETIQALTASGLLQTGEATVSSAEASYWLWSEDYQNWYHDNGDGTFEWAQAGETSGQTSQSGGKGKGKGRAKKRET